MGMLLYPVFNSPTTLRCKTTGEYLAGYFEVLDAYAEQFGLTPICAFADSRMIPEDFDGDPEELAEMMGPCNDWYDTAEGERAMVALADAVANMPRELELSDAREAVETELRDLADVLRKASIENLRFRMEIS